MVLPSEAKDRIRRAITSPGAANQVINALDEVDGQPADASFTIGDEAANVINVGIQLKDANGDDCAVRQVVQAYISGVATGDGVVATAPNNNVVIGTDGTILHEDVADKWFTLLSEEDGDIDLDISDTGAATFYLVVILPTGAIVVSGAITFA